MRHLAPSAAVAASAAGTPAPGESEIVISLSLLDKLVQKNCVIAEEKVELENGWWKDAVRAVSQGIPVVAKETHADSGSGGINASSSTSGSGAAAGGGGGGTPWTGGSIFSSKAALKAKSAAPSSKLGKQASLGSMPAGTPGEQAGDAGSYAGSYPGSVTGSFTAPAPAAAGGAAGGGGWAPESEAGGWTAVSTLDTASARAAAAAASAQSQPKPGQTLKRAVFGGDDDDDEEDKGGGSSRGGVAHAYLPSQSLPPHYPSSAALGGRNIFQTSHAALSYGGSSSSSSSIGMVSSIGSGWGERGSRAAGGPPGSSAASSYSAGYHLGGLPALNVNTGLQAAAAPLGLLPFEMASSASLAKAATSGKAQQGGNSSSSNSGGSSRWGEAPEVSQGSSHAHFHHSALHSSSKRADADASSSPFSAALHPHSLPKTLQVLVERFLQEGHTANSSGGNAAATAATKGAGFPSSSSSSSEASYRPGSGYVTSNRKPTFWSVTPPSSTSASSTDMNNSSSSGSPASSSSTNAAAGSFSWAARVVLDTAYWLAVNPGNRAGRPLVDAELVENFYRALATVSMAAGRGLPGASAGTAAAAAAFSRGGRGLPSSGFSASAGDAAGGAASLEDLFLQAVFAVQSGSGAEILRGRRQGDALTRTTANASGGLAAGGAGGGAGGAAGGGFSGGAGLGMGPLGLYDTSPDASNQFIPPHSVPAHETLLEGFAAMEISSWREYLPNILHRMCRDVMVRDLRPSLFSSRMGLTGTLRGVPLLERYTPGGAIVRTITAGQGMGQAGQDAGPIGGSAAGAAGGAAGGAASSSSSSSSSGSAVGGASNAPLAAPSAAANTSSVFLTGSMALQLTGGARKLDYSSSSGLTGGAGGAAVAGGAAAAGAGGGVGMAGVGSGGGSLLLQDKPALILRKREDLSLRTGPFVLLEYTEQLPPFIQAFGMSSRLVTFVRQQAQAARLHAEGIAHETLIELMDLERPFPLLGAPPAGQAATVLCNQLFNAPVFKHKPSDRDFLLVLMVERIRTAGGGGAAGGAAAGGGAAGGGGKVSRTFGPVAYVRPIERLYTVGQQEPCVAINHPGRKLGKHHSFDAETVVFLKHFFCYEMLLLFQRSEELAKQQQHREEVTGKKGGSGSSSSTLPPGVLRLRDVSKRFQHFFGSAGETFLIAYVSDVAEYNHAGLQFIRKTDAPTAEEYRERVGISLEQLCMFESQLAGKELLQKVGLQSLSHDEKALEDSVKHLQGMYDRMIERLKTAIAATNVAAAALEAAGGAAGGAAAGGAAGGGESGSSSGPTAEISTLWEHDGGYRRFKRTLAIAQAIFYLLQTAPWATTRNYLSFREGAWESIAVQDSAGVGDPSGRGEAFSFVDEAARRRIVSREWEGRERGRGRGALTDHNGLAVFPRLSPAVLPSNLFFPPSPLPPCRPLASLRSAGRAQARTPAPSLSSRWQPCCRSTASLQRGSRG